MPRIKVGTDRAGDIELHYHDHGDGQPVVLIHGWPLSERSWEKQEPVLLAQGYRVIKYDRRGFGESSKPVDGYDYDTFADDLNALMTQLDLREAVLVGFSMGTGEIARYLATYGSDRVSKAVFISGILPALLKAPDNPEGVDKKVFDDLMKKIVEDRPKFLTGFFKDFYSHSMLGPKDVSEETLRYSWLLAVMASPVATLKCIPAWLEDFRTDIAKINVPSLVIHGDGDKIVPIGQSGHRLRDALPGCRYFEIKGGPHGVLASHPEEISHALIDFLSDRAAAGWRPEARH